MKKISILALHLGYGGIEKAIINLANSLCDSYKVEIACTYKLYDIPAFYINPKIKVKYLTDVVPNKNELFSSLKKFKIFSFVKEAFVSIDVLYKRKSTMVKYLKECDADVIISTRDIYNFWSGKYSKNTALKIGWEHNHYHGNYRYANKIIRSVSKLDYLVLVSKNLKSFYKDKTDCKCVYIPNSIDEVPKKRSSLVSKNLISVGRLSREKGCMDLLEMFNILRKKDSSFVLNIIGDGPLKNDMKKYISDNNLSNNVIMHGFQGKDYINKFLSKSSIYIMTSYTESFGIVLLEAMSYGIPCIAYDSAEGACEVIKNNYNGYLIKNRDPLKMINKIENLINDKDKRNEMGKNAYVSVSKYTSDVVKNDWINLIEKSDSNE